MAELGFDTQQRFEAIESVLYDLGLHFGEPGASGFHALDVGGYPCLLADYLSPDLAVQTVDRPPCERTDYVQASGTALPFADGQFPLVVASDTLEHIPPDEREAFVAEMVRVSARYVLVAGPLRSAPVDRAERALAKFYEATRGQSHRWLAEHRAFGLPRAARLVDWLAPHGTLSVRSNGFLPDWTLLMGMTFLDEHLAGAPEGFLNPGEALSDRYRELRERHGPDDGQPAYRHLVLLDRQGPPADREAALELFPPECREDHEPPEVRFLLKLQVALLYSLAERFAPRAEAGETGVEQAYLEQLERSLRLAEQEIGRLRGQTGGGGSSAGSGTRRGWWIFRRGSGPNDEES